MKAGLRLCCLQIPKDRFSCVEAHIIGCISSLQSDSSDDEYLKAKKPKGVRGCRGLKKKSSSILSSDSVIEIPLASNSHVYSTKVVRCFGHMNAHDYDEELHQAEQETVVSGRWDTLLQIRGATF